MDEMLITTQTYSQKWERWFTLLLVFHVLAQCLFSAIEKNTLWGEMFVLIALFYITTIPYHLNGHQKHILAGVCMWVFFFPVYGVFISMFYWQSDFNMLYLGRHLVFFYFCIFFFFAFKHAYLIIDCLKKYSKHLLWFIPFSMVFLHGGGLALPTVLGLMLVGLSQWKDKPKFFYLGLALSFLVVIRTSASGTNKFILAFYLCFLFLNFIARFWTKYISTKISKIIFAILLIAGILFTVKMAASFYQQTTQMALLGQTVASLEETSKDAGTDLGGFWRLILWSHLYGRFLEFPWGLGLGTPLFSEWLDGFVMLNLSRPGENYVQGAHNSFITFIVRLGIPALLLFLYLFYHITKMAIAVFKKIQFKPFKTSESRLLTGILWAFASIFIGSNFNVALESPLHAGSFWFSFGLFARVFGDYLAVSPNNRPTTNSLDDE